MRTKKHRAHKASPNKTEQTHKKHISNYTNKTGKKASTRTTCKKKLWAKLNWKNCTNAKRIIHHVHSIQFNEKSSSTKKKLKLHFISFSLGTLGTFYVACVQFFSLMLQKHKSSFCHFIIALSSNVLQCQTELSPALEAFVDLIYVPCTHVGSLHYAICGSAIKLFCGRVYKNYGITIKYK